MKIYGDIQSGNCYKIKLLCSFLSIEHEWIHVNILESETHTPEFLSKNPNAKIPLLELSDGRCLSESNAILYFLSEGTSFSSDDKFVKAKILQWQFFEQYSHEPFIAVARFISKYLGLPLKKLMVEPKIINMVVDLIVVGISAFVDAVIGDGGTAHGSRRSKCCESLRISGTASEGRRIGLSRNDFQ